MKCLFDKNKPHFTTWLRLHNRDNSAGLHAGPLYYAALCRFRDLAELVADAHLQEVNDRGGKHVTPLHAAVDNGQLGVAKLVVERGAVPYAPRLMQGKANRSSFAYFNDSLALL